MTNSELAQSIRCNLFGNRDSVKEAYQYVEEVAKDSSNPAAILTAVHVMMNTIASYIENIDELETVTNS